ncbi:non-ribosomal peptide synthetase [Thermoactinospora rubra]|uniref:non-ribosomal peptide synthetase n=1 Tax=Thermoactinospora rubra TaxID=1088767 RepID=UPI000A103F1A|nr:non-ribosomal peptide synthetase [Thermoactinospora rubra]
MSGDLVKRWAALSPERRAALLERARGAVPAWGPAGLVPRPRPGGRSPASYAQGQQWFLDKLAAGEAAYLVPFALRLRGPLDVARLRAGLDAVVARHEVLRSHLEAADDGELWQVTAPELRIPLPIEQVPGEAAAYARAAELAAERFDLSRGPLVRTALLRLDEHDHVLVWIAHHAVADGFSVDVLLKELRAALDPAAGPPPPLPVQYADFAAWQRERLTPERLETLVAFWRDRLGDAPPCAVAPDRPRPAVQTFRGDTVTFDLPPLGELARARGTTVFAVLLAALHVALARYSGEPDAVLGVVLSGRLRAEVEPLIGPFATTVPLRLDASGDPPFRELLDRVSRELHDGLDHQEVPFDHLVRGLGRARDADRNPLYQVLFSMEAVGGGPVELAPGLTAEVSGVANGTAWLDLHFAVRQSGDTLACRLTYNTDLYDRGTAEQLAGAFQAAARFFAASPDRPVGDFSPLEEAERARVMAAWDRPAGPRLPYRGVLDLVGEVVAAEPDRVAVVHGDRGLTYRELEEWSNQVAHAVLEAGGGPGTVVGLAVDRTHALVPALLGVIKSGSAYLPLDPSYPASRVEFMLADSGAGLVLGEGGLQPDGPEVRAASREPVARRPALEDPAYVIYTSGSTGTPKGVRVGHRALGNFLAGMAELGLMRREDSVVALTALTFDIAADELLLPLTVGARVVVADRATARDGVRLRALLEEQGVTVLHGTPATFRMLIDAGWTGGNVRRALCGGEAMTARLASELCERVPEVWNLYGPTEATVWSLAHRVSPGGTPPIGTPLPNTTAYVLDERMRPVPPGVLGELYLGGAGLADGYVNRPELTAERFVTGPLGRRLYRTGDVASYGADGVFRFHGRRDHQVKLRGFRVELGEVEAALTAHPDVTDAVAMVDERGEGDARLVAFVRAAPGTAERDLLAAAAAALPGHMVPSRIRVVPEFPLTTSGKVDRRALLAAMDPQGDEPGPEPPATPTERWLAHCWERLLGGRPVGRADNFFLVGGHSLLATRILAAIREEYGVDLPMEDFFAAPTVEALARRVDELAAGEDDLLRRVEQMSDEEVARALAAMNGGQPA